MLRFDDVPAGLISVLSKLDLYKQIRWQSYEEDDRREPTDKLTEAAAASSRLRDQDTSQRQGQADADLELHYLMIDLDVPAFLVPSTHPGHSHLYVETPIVWRDLEQLLRALAACGVIEHGYANASIDRKATTLRLPWIEKKPEGDDALLRLGDVRNTITNMLIDPDWQGQTGSDDFQATLDQHLDNLAHGETRASEPSITGPQQDLPMVIHQAGPEGIPPEAFSGMLEPSDLTGGQTDMPQLSQNELIWRGVKDAGGRYVHTPDRNAYPGPGGWSVISCAAGDHDPCFAFKPSTTVEPYRSPWMDIGDKLRAPEKYDVIDERHNCGYEHHNCGWAQFHDWHDYMDARDADIAPPATYHCEGFKPDGAN